MKDTLLKKLGQIRKIKGKLSKKTILLKIGIPGKAPKEWKKILNEIWLVLLPPKALRATRYKKKR